MSLLTKISWPLWCLAMEVTVQTYRGFIVETSTLLGHKTMWSMMILLDMLPK